MPRDPQLSQSSTVQIIIVGDSVAPGLRRYEHVRKKSFKSSFNLGIGGDSVENILFGAGDISFLDTIPCVIIHCGTNNISHNKLKDMATSII